MEDGSDAGLGNGGNGGNENAFSFLPDGLQSLSEGYEKPETFWADVSRLKGMDAELKALRGVSPESLATDEDYDRAYKALGRPDDKSGYKLPEAWSGDLWQPDGTSGGKASEEVAAEVNQLLKISGDAEQFADIMHKCGVTQQQAAKLFDHYGSVLARHVAARQAAQAENAPGKVMTELWPEDTLAHQQTATRGAASLGLVEAINESGLAGNPLVLKLCHALGEATGEDKIVGTTTGGASLPTGAAAREELHRVIGSEAYKSGDKQAIRTAEALSARVHLK
jgi:hypothetical protein